MAGGNIGDNRVNIFCRGGGSKIKEQDLQKKCDLYYAAIFSGIPFKRQNGLPSRMYELSITQGLSESFQVATAKEPINHEVNDSVVPDSIQLTTSKDSSNSSNEDIGNSNNSDPFQCDIMPSSYDEDETASIFMHFSR
jgi:hypothetical protein